MSKPGPVGGAATLSSFRVQKAFSINFRENKRLLSEIRLIENEHIRNIRHIKQEIKETRIWWEGVRESTGESHHGLRPDSEPSLKKNKRRKALARSKTAEPQPVIPEYPPPTMSQFSGDDYDDMTTKYSEQAPVPKVHFESTDGPNASNNTLTVPATRPWTEMNGSSQEKTNQSNLERHRADLKSEPAGNPGGQRMEPPKEESAEEAKAEQRKSRTHSATSARSSLASLTTYQRRNKLQSMMVKKQNPLEYKRQMNTKDCQRVTNKMNAYLSSLSDGIRITMPDLTKWGVDPERHETPFAQDVNLN